MRRRLCSVLLSSVMLLVPAQGGTQALAQADYCATTLQSLINDASAGSTLILPGCIYREAVTITKPLTIDGSSGAEIRGSDVWTDWMPTPYGWVSSLTLPPLLVQTDTQPACTPGTDNRCFWPEQVFLNGQPQVEVGGASGPAPGQFSLTNDRHVLLGSDPSGQFVEVSTRAHWITSRSDGITLEYLTFHHAANSYNDRGALGNDGRSNWSLLSSTLTDAHAGAVGLVSGTNVRVIGNDISQFGQNAIGGYRTNAAEVRDNRLHDGNQAGLFNVNWDAAAVKFAACANVNITGNEIYSNFNSNGVWIDIGCQAGTISANRIHDNTGAGIFYEVSSGASISSNSIWSNGGIGIWLSTSANVEVGGNISAWNGVAVRVQADTRSDAPKAVNTHISIHDNVLAVTGTAEGLTWRDSTGHAGLDAAASNNLATNNVVWPGIPNARALTLLQAASIPTQPIAGSDAVHLDDPTLTADDS